jgi:hypothetical protein
MNKIEELRRRFEKETGKQWWEDEPRYTRWLESIIEMEGA